MRIMSLRMAFGMLAAGLGLGLGITTARAQSGPPLDYDAVSASDVQLLQNPSFEQRRQNYWQAVLWGVPETEKERMRLVEAPGQAHHGLIYFSVDASNGAKSFGGHIKGFPVGGVQGQAWLKGRGAVEVWVDAQDAQHTIVFSSPKVRLPVNADGWKSASFNFDLPALAQGQAAGQADKLVLMFTVTGQVDFDELVLYQPAALNQSMAGRVGEAVPEHLPFVEIPRITAPPRIDGQLNDEMWQHAAALTGLRLLLSGEQSPAQAVFYLGYDDANLYVGVKAMAQGAFVEGKPGRDAAYAGENEGVEVWLAPAAGAVYQFLGWPAGGYYDRDQAHGPQWDSAIQYASKVEVLPETVSGIETFDKRRWTAEFAIPFAQLGRPTPKVGEVWRANFCRDLSATGETMGNNHRFSSWAVMKSSFDTPGLFGALRFGPQGPSTQLLELGQLADGQLSAAGLVSKGRGAVQVTARTATRDGRTLVYQQQRLTGKSAAAAPFQIDESFRSNRPLDAVFSLTVREADSGRLLSVYEHAFRSSPSLKVRLIPLFRKDELCVEVDASKLGALPRSAQVAVFRRNGAERLELARSPWPTATSVTVLRCALSALPVGSHELTVELLGADSSEPIGRSALAFERIEKPAWLDNDIGKMDGVPEPWTPIRASGSDAQIADRDYQISDLGLPTQIIAKGETLLTTPARLFMDIDGKESAWQTQPLRITAQTPRHVVYALRAQAGPVRLTGEARLEFDGFVNWQVKLESATPVTVNALRIELPLVKDRSLYARGKRRAYGDEVTVTAGLWGQQETQPVMVANMPTNACGWAWPDKWLAEIWVGDDERGLSVMNQSQRNFIGPKRVTIDRRAADNVLNIHLVSGPFRMTRALEYQLFWQATPIKPLTPNPKLWHLHGVAGSKLSVVPPFFERMYGVEYWNGIKPSYAQYINPQEAKAMLAVYGPHRVRVLPYFAVSAAWAESPEFKYFGNEWRREPTGGFGQSQGEFAIISHNSTYTDFLLEQTRKLIDELGFGGMYLDVSGIASSVNPYQDPCDRDPDTGAVLETLDLLGHREYYMRAYQFMKSGGRDAILYRHGVPVAGIAGFVDHMMQGEEWGGEGHRQYQKLTPDMFRIREMYTQYGVPFTWYCFHGYWRGDETGGIVPLHTILAYTLPHRVLPNLGHGDIYRVWDTFDPFWAQGQFIGYWSPKSPVRTQTPGVLASVYFRPDRREALLVVANWSDQTLDSVDLAIDFQALGINPARAKVTRAVEHPIVSHIHRDRNQIPSYTTRDLRYSQGVVNVQLQPRNLEIIRLREGP
jgi:hypothetical protein